MKIQLKSSLYGNRNNWSYDCIYVWKSSFHRCGINDVHVLIEKHSDLIFRNGFDSISIDFKHMKTNRMFADFTEQRIDLDLFIDWTF